RQNAALVTGQRRVGRIVYGGNVGALLVIVVEAQARLDAELVRDAPAELPEQGQAGVLEIDIVVGGQPIEHGRIVGIGIGRGQQPLAGRRALHLETVGVQLLVKAERAGYVVN